MKEGMESKKRKKGYALGEAVKDKKSGQKMYVSAAWSPEVSCVYFDAEKESLVEVQMYPEDL
ncbi:PF09926 repeat protein, partial [Leptospira santarosai str. HAI134]